MAKVKGKLVSGGGSVRVDRRTYSVEPPGKGNVFDMTALRANNFEVEGALVPGLTSAVGGKTGQGAMVFRLDRKYLKRHTTA